MTDEKTPPVARRNRRFGTKRASRWLLFVGDCRELGDALASKPLNLQWLALSFLDALLRGYGQVVFANNPVTGLLFLIALTVANPFVSLVGLVTATIGLLTSVAIQQPGEAVRAGLTTYNPLLVGLVTSAVLPALYGLDMDYRHWLFMVAGAIFSVYLTSALASLLGSIGRYPLPCLAVPFITMQIMVFLCVLNSPTYSPPPEISPSPTNNYSTPPLPSTRLTRHADGGDITTHIQLAVLNQTYHDNPTQNGTINSTTVANIIDKQLTPVEALTDGTVVVEDNNASMIQNETYLQTMDPIQVSAETNQTLQEEEEWTETNADSYSSIAMPQSVPVLENVSLNKSGKPTEADAEEQVVAMGTSGVVGEAADPHHVDWGQVFTGVILSMTQVFGACDAPAAVLMYLGVVIFSPTTGLMCLLGATLSTLTGLLFCPPPYTAVYEGVWGFNGLLCAAGLGGFCFVLTPQSAALALVCALFATCLQNVLNPMFAAVPMPIMSVPFNISTLLFLCVTTADFGSGLVRPDALSFPEKHRHDWNRARGRETEEQQSGSSSSESCPEKTDKQEEAEQQKKLTKEEV